jgi:hypothetical protein
MFTTIDPSPCHADVKKNTSVTQVQDDRCVVDK